MTYHKAITAAILAHIIWGAGTPIFKLALLSIPPFSMAVIRFLIASIFLLSFYLLLGKKPKIKKADWPKLLLFGLLAVPVNIGLYFFGLSLSSALNVSVISGKTPLISASTAVLFSKERTSPPVVIGLLAALLGSLIIIGRPLLEFDQNQELNVLIGNILVLLAAGSWVAATFILKDVSQKYSFIDLTTIGFLLGFFCLLPLATLEYLNNPYWMQDLSLSAYFGVSYAIIFSSILAYSLYTFSLKTISVTEATLAAYIMPISGIILSAVLLGEKITFTFIIGVVLIVIGMGFLEIWAKSSHLK